MTTRKLVCRMMLTAAVSTASVVYSVDSDLYGVESATKTPPSGTQPAQYQPGQGGGQPNSAVTQELNRMFQESGQPMPSMNPADLPNAQGQHSNMVRPKPQTTKPQTTMAQPAKRNFLQKFMGKITGQDQKAADARVVPPVPPGHNSSAPGAHSNAGMRQTVQSQNVQNAQNRNMQNVAAQSAAQQQRMAPQQRMASQGANSQAAQPPLAGSYSAQSGTRQGSVAPLRTAQTVQPNGHGQRMNQPTKSVPPVPAANQLGTAAAGPQQVASGTQQYVQPGTAPAFMPSSRVAHPGTHNQVQSAVPGTSVASSEPLAAPPVDDDFEDPFKDSEDDGDASDAMDLDSLIEMPKSESTASVPLSAETEPAESVRAAVVDTAAVSSQSSFTEDGAEPDGVAEELNPFTGVRLNETDAEMFDPGLNESAPAGKGSAVPKTVSPAENTETFGAPAPPMEDFGSNLPAINLPAVDEIPVAPATSNSAAASELNASSPVDVTESEATPLRSVDAERLQQAAEQNRRMRQQRLIHSRTGQAGFKGFCPVELRDRRDLVDVNPEFTATFGLQTYSFSSAESRAAFEADPSRYAPAAGGSDVVLLVNSGEEQPGMLDYALWYRDRLYLFRSRETMALFNEDPMRFANQY